MRQLALIAALSGTPVLAQDPAPLRIATYNVSMTRDAPGGLIADLLAGDDRIAAVAEVIQRVRPDVILLNEVDRDPDGRALTLFRERYLAVSQNGAEPIDYPHAVAPPSNTGVPTGHDLDGDGATDGPGDAQGYGAFEGQYAFALLSRYPIDTAGVRTFQRLLWADMPGSYLAGDPELAAFYGGAAADLRLSSKTHAILPVRVGGRVLQIVAAHPTPPVFDGPEDRNGKRNHDEIRLIADLVSGADWPVDDAGRAGGLPDGAAFVILGDMNADPADGDGVPGAMRQLLDHPAVQGSEADAALIPSSEGGSAAAAEQAGANEGQSGNPAFDTADFGFAGAGAPDDAPGNLRVDYALPSVAGLTLTGGGVFWLAPGDPLFPLGEWPASDHRLVWIDVVMD